jgi:dihydrofolate reductase
MISIISATALNGVIGLKGENKLLWKSEVDMEFFKENTKGAVLVMGNSTAKSLTRPFPGRDNVVLSRKEKTGLRNGFHYFNNINDILSEYENFMVIGGEDLYNLFINITDEVILTTINLDFNNKNDYAYFPIHQLEEDFYVVYESNMIKDIDKQSGIPLTLIFSRWHRDITRLH